MKELDTFNPTVAELRALVAKTGAITEIKDPFDEEEVKAVEDAKREIAYARGTITKKGKALREDALAYQRAVIAKEKELLAEIEPEEDRLKELIEGAKQAGMLENRRKALPERKKRMDEEGIPKDKQPDDAALLTIDANQFEVWLAVVRQEMRDRELEELRAKERERQEAEEEKRRTEEHARDIEKAKEEERMRIEGEHEAEKVRRREEAERIAKEERYIAWRAEQGWTEETKGEWKQEKVGDAVILWKKVGTFTIEN